MHVTVVQLNVLLQLLTVDVGTAVPVSYLLLGPFSSYWIALSSLDLKSCLILTCYAVLS